VKRWPPLLLLLAACAGSASDHERLGDGAFAEGDFATAVGEYRAAVRGRSDGRLWAKLGLAALRRGDYRDAADAYQKLAQADRTRSVEAARGLEQVARLADHDGNAAALQEAVEALRTLAPERVSPRHTIALVKSGRLEAAEAAGMGPLALAAAGDPAATDQMLVQYGSALQAITACAEAAEIYQVALRRSRDPALRLRATRGLGDCGLQLGQESLLMDKPEIAEQWFLRVLAVDSTTSRGRRALVGLGDARVLLGDLLGATLVFQDAMKADPNDSIGSVANQRLIRLGAKAGTADSQ
jgi:tetratricopeptide (TPR) repeat protein